MRQGHRPGGCGSALRGRGDCFSPPDRRHHRFHALLTEENALRASVPPAMLLAHRDAAVVAHAACGGDPEVHAARSWLGLADVAVHGKSLVRHRRYRGSTSASWENGDGFGTEFPTGEPGSIPTRRRP